MCAKRWNSCPETKRKETPAKTTDIDEEGGKDQRQDVERSVKHGEPQGRSNMDESAMQAAGG